MAKSINLIWDDTDLNPANHKPMIMHHRRKAFLIDTKKRFIWRSWDYGGGTLQAATFGVDPPLFKLIFDQAIDPWIDKATPPGVVVGGTIEFVAQKQTVSGRACYEVDIKFKEPTGQDFPNRGFSYDLEMKGKTMDPRVRPH